MFPFHVPLARRPMPRRCSMVSLAVPLVLALAGLLAPSGWAPPERKEIAVSIDDAPVVGFHTHPSQWHRRLVIDSMAAALRRFDAAATVFVIGNQVEHAEGQERLAHCLDQGVSAGNHSFTHRSCNTHSDEEGAGEVDRTNALLAPFARGYGRPVRYFRFPFLAERATPEQKRAWQELLASRGLVNARVTLRNEDWKFDAAYTEAELQEDWARRYEVGQAFLQHLRDAVAFGAGPAVAGRSIRQVLLLHANRINRDYLGQILADLRRQGYTLVSLDDAHADPIYRADDRWVSEDGTSLLEHLRQTRRKAPGQGSRPARPPRSRMPCPSRSPARAVGKALFWGEGTAREKPVK